MKDSTIKQYFKNSFNELSKVVWPTKNQAIRLTIIVLVLTALFAVFLGVFDLAFSRLYTYLLELN